MLPRGISNPTEIFRHIHPKPRREMQIKTKRTRSLRSHSPVHHSPAEHNSSGCRVAACILRQAAWPVASADDSPAGSPSSPSAHNSPGRRRHIPETSITTKHDETMNEFSFLITNSLGIMKAIRSTPVGVKGRTATQVPPHRVAQLQHRNRKL